MCRYAVLCVCVARGGWKEVIRNRVHALISKSSLSERTLVLAAFYNYRLSV